MARARARTTRPPQIHKFGGASLADAAAIGHAVRIVQAQRPEPLVVVVSAMSGVTDALLDGAARAARGTVPVVPGFLGAAPDGQVATLGRGGSDLTATLLARVLGAREVSLWKDVPGLLTADPRIVPDARVVPQVHVREAAELAYYG